MRNLFGHGRISLALLAGVLAACNDPVAPPPLETTYVMVRLNDHVLPWNNAGGCCVYIRGSLTLDDGEYSVALDVINRDLVSVQTIRGEGSYLQDGTGLTFASDLDTDPLQLSRGTIDGDLLILFLGGEDGGAGDQWEAWFLPGDDVILPPLRRIRAGGRSG